MNFPFQFGVPQIILLLIALGGFALFLYAAHSLIRGEKHYGRLTPQEKDDYYNYGRLPRRKHFRWQHGIGGVLLLFICASLLWMTFLIQSYLGLTGNILVAHVQAIDSATTRNDMTVLLTLYDQNGHPVITNDLEGHPTQQQAFDVKGNEWILQGDMIKVATWLNIVGMHSGYKLTRLEGRYDDINQERNATHSAYELNGGDDGFFQNMHANQGWISPFIDAQYGSGVFNGPGTYDVYVSQTGLYAIQAKS